MQQSNYNTEAKHLIQDLFVFIWQYSLLLNYKFIIQNIYTREFSVPILKL